MKIIQIAFLLSFINFTVSAQNLSVSQTASAELTKSSRSGRYGGTFINGDQLKVIYVSSTNDDGVQMEQYDLNLSGGESKVEDKFVNADDASKQMPWYIPKSKVENMASSKGKWLNATAAFGGGMKLFRGTIKKNYMLGVYTGMEFVKEESIKPKTGDIWRITPGGYKSLSDLDALATSNNFYQDLEKFGNPLLMPANDTLLASGVITEKVSIKNPPPTAANRVAVLTMNGMNFDDMKYDIYMLPYTALTVTSGLGQDDNLTSLFAPLNGPTTVKALKHLLWKDNKDYFTVMRFSDQRELVDSTSFRSKLMWGDFAIMNGQGATFIVGKGKADFDGWYRGLQYKSITGMQVTKVKDGKLIYSQMFDEDMLKKKLIGPEGKKVKLDLHLHHNYFREIIDLPNGDALVLGYSPLQAYALQMSPQGELKAFYYIPSMGKAGETGIINYQYEIKGDDLILVLNQMPAEFTTDAQISSSTTKAGNMSITTTTVKKLNEVFLQSMIVRINTSTTKMSNVLELDGKDFYPMGSFPAMFTNNAVYFTGREKGPKGKVIHVARIEL